MKRYKLLLVLAAAGLIFSGYLSAVKLFTKTCALGESCPYFLGYPACWYGFVMYLTLTIAALVLVSGRNVRGALKWLIGVSGAGILFAGYFSAIEISRWLSNGFVLRYKLGLPTCAYGLIFYLAIFAIAIPALRASSREI